VSTRTVYDTMVFLQWAALPEGRHHATIRALYDGTVRLCVSQALFDEVREVLSRPNVVARSPNINPDRLKEVLAITLEMAEWVADVPRAFTWPQHPDDDHLFNLAIAAKAEFLVTWESRILKFASETTEDARHLRILTPQLEIITPKQLAERLKNG
jgi:putative PIN family toxin of toxin-antitoxin system